MLEIMVLGFTISLLLVQMLITSGRLQAANEQLDEAAEAGAAYLARYDDIGRAGLLLQAAAPGATFEFAQGPDWVRATVRRRVALLGPPGARLYADVTGSATVRRSPYRSTSG